MKFFVVKLAETLFLKTHFHCIFVYIFLFLFFSILLYWEFFTIHLNKYRSLTSLSVKLEIRQFSSIPITTKVNFLFYHQISYKISILIQWYILSKAENNSESIWDTFLQCSPQKLSLSGCLLINFKWLCLHQCLLGRISLDYFPLFQLPLCQSENIWCTIYMIYYVNSIKNYRVEIFNQLKLYLKIRVAIHKGYN